MTTIALSYKALHHRVKTLWSKQVSDRTIDFNMIKIPWRLVLWLGVIFCAFMLVFYVFSINQLTKGTYLIKNYNREMSKLLDEHKMLQAHFAEQGFLGDVQAKARALSFEKTTDITYIEIIESPLASNKVSKVE